MHLMDFVVAVGVLLTLIQTAYIMLTFHSASVSAASGTPKPLMRRHFLVMGVLTLSSWVAFGFDYYSRRESEPSDFIASRSHTGNLFHAELGNYILDNGKRRTILPAQGRRRACQKSSSK